VIQHYSSRNIGTTQLENAEELKQAQQLCYAERSLRIGNITSLIECTRRLIQSSAFLKTRIIRRNWLPSLSHADIVLVELDSLCSICEENESVIINK
jgi:hypothetical protein